MLDILYSTVKNIILFLVLMTIVMNLIGNSSYKQYIRIFCGMVLILIVIMPIMQLFRVDNKLNYYFDLNQFKVSANDISEDLVSSEESGVQRVISEYKSNLSQQIEDKLAIHNLQSTSIDIELEEEKENENFGAIQAIQVKAKNQTDAEDSSSEIDQIVIDKIKINQDNERILSTEEPELESLVELNLKEEIASFYGLNVEQVQIDIEQ